MRQLRIAGVLILSLSTFCLAPLASAQHAPWSPRASQLVVPQAGAWRVAPGSGQVEVTKVAAGAVIVGQVATTTIDVFLRNPTLQRLEAELVMPVPSGATIRTFTFQGEGAEPTAELLPAGPARATYEAIVRKTRDPALLEFVGSDLIRSSVFPVEPGGTQTLRLTFEHLLVADGPRVDYVLPRSASVTATTPWSIAVRAKAAAPIATVYSPSHAIDVHRRSDRIVSARMQASAATEPGAFRLSILTAAGASVGATSFVYPDPARGGGWLLLLGSLPPATNEPAQPREVTLVLDRSGSMKGAKLKQARAAALQVIAGLAAGEHFNVLVYNEAVERFAARPVARTEATLAQARDWLGALEPRGGTNIHDALVEALAQPATPGALPLVLFMTDGLPTIGQTSEGAILTAVAKGNPARRRVTTFGVGVDVNTPLLEALARDSRGSAHFVLPNEDVEGAVATVFQRLTHPRLARPRLVDAGRRLHDALPQELPDLFEGDQLVVLARYTGSAPIDIELRGDSASGPRRFSFSVEPARASTRFGFVPRLWASRRIASLVDAIRRAGADRGAPRVAGRPPAAPDIRELVDEVVRLSTEFGVLTEYTAFLARTGTDLSRPDAIRAEAYRNFVDRAVRTRSGAASVNQSMNVQRQLDQSWANPRNAYVDHDLRNVAITQVQQINDRTLYQQNGRWEDPRAAGVQGAPTRIAFGSPAWGKLLGELAANGRQGLLAVSGDVLLLHRGQPFLVLGPESAATQTQTGR